MERILIGPSSFGVADAEPLHRLSAVGYEVLQNRSGRKLSEQELLQMLPGVVGLVAGLEELPGRILEQSQLRVISRCGAGVSNVDLDAARRLGITVRNTPDAPTTAVAELTVGAMLALLRHIATTNADLHDGKWIRPLGGQIEGKTVVIVGFGRIGRAVARLLQPFGATLVAVDSDTAARGPLVESANLDEALARADIVTLHASGEETILGERELRLLKPGALVLHGGRGGQIDEDALCRALDSGHVTGAWVDAFRDEPYSGPLTRYPHVLLTPHVGSLTAECRRRMEREAVDNLLAALHPRT